MTIGIYKIENADSGTMYIGQSVNIEARIKKHIRNLSNGCHENDYLQRSYDKYGKDKFIFEIVKECSREELNSQEIYFINSCNTLFPNGYNLKTGGNVRIEYPEIVRQKIGDGNRGKIVSEETKQKIKENSSRWNLGRAMPEETKAKIRATKAANPKVPWNKGLSTDESTKQKLREAGKRRAPASEETRALLSKSLQGSKKGRSGYYGVSIDKRSLRKKYVASIKCNNARYRLGYFETAEEAALAYDKKALELFGDSARTNFLS